jgi:pimeloyl-ACP methyl ester carboxylesterase
VAVRSCRVKLFEGGDGPAVVLLHGLLGRPDYLLPLARSLARHRRVLVPALPGHGTDRVCPFGFTVVADLLAEAVASAGVERPALLGHSYGVPVVVHWASRHPVSSLVCASPIGIAPLLLDWTRHLARVAGPVAAAADALAPALASTAAGRRLVFGWFVGMRHPDAVDPALGERLIRGAASAAVALDETLPPLHGLDLRPAAAQVTCPSCVVWGERDPHGPGNGAQLARALRGEPIVMPGLGHMPMLEAPLSFRLAIDRFI